MKILFFLIVILLSGCAPHVPAPVSDLSRNIQTADVIRIVRPGDTLYSVAWSAGVDYRDLAYWNNLKDPYVIKIGKQLILSGNSRPKQPVASKVVISAIEQPSSTIEKTTIAGQTDSVNSESNTSAVLKQPPLNKVTQPKKPSAQVSTSKKSWNWPVKGNLITSFSNKTGSKGIDISVASGTAVKASKGGLVVYAGAALRGYGQLIIVKHSDDFLSAYGHNRRILVEEGDTIVARQTIAESGIASDGVSQLHFEIRKNGKPVNPLQYLSS